jgi:hypothetical protein
VIYAFQCQHIQEGQNEIKEVTDVSLRSQKWAQSHSSQVWVEG